MKLSHFIYLMFISASSLHWGSHNTMIVPSSRMYIHMNVCTCILYWLFLLHVPVSSMFKYYSLVKGFFSSIFRCNTDINDSDCEVNILRGINFNVQNPKDVDTYVRVEFPYPSVSCIHVLQEVWCKCLANIKTVSQV